MAAMDEIRHVVVLMFENQRADFPGSPLEVLEDAPHAVFARAVSAAPDVGGAAAEHARALIDSAEAP